MINFSFYVSTENCLDMHSHKWCWKCVGPVRARQAAWCCDFRAAKLNVCNDLPSFPFCLWKGFVLLSYLVAAWGGWLPSFRFCLWGRSFPSLGIIMTGDCTMNLAVLLPPWSEKPALSTLWHGNVGQTFTALKNISCAQFGVLLPIWELISDAWLTG